MLIVILPNDKPVPAGKHADAELHFDRRDGLLDGLKLVGFAIWESQWPTKSHRYPNWRVTMPARTYQAGQERRTYNLVRPCQETLVRGIEAAASAALSDAILEAYAASLDETELEAPAPAPPPPARQPARPAPQAHAARRPSVPQMPLTARRPPARPEPPPYTDDDMPF